MSRTIPALPHCSSSFVGSEITSSERSASSTNSKPTLIDRCTVLGDLSSVTMDSTTSIVQSASQVSSMDFSSADGNLMYATQQPGMHVTPAGGVASPHLHSNFSTQQSFDLSKPKAQVHAIYAKAPYRKIFSKLNYQTWHDGGQAHMLKWASVFICPINVELFFSGRVLGLQHEALTETNQGNIAWFSKKNDAEHAAAARAIDCLKHRNDAELATNASGTLNLMVSPSICLERPYLLGDARYSLPSSPDIPVIPMYVVDAVCNQQQDIRGRQNVNFT